MADTEFQDQAVERCLFEGKVQCCHGRRHQAGPGTALGFHIGPGIEPGVGARFIQR